MGKDFNIKTFADQIAAVDNELGRIADYEGENDGPTYAVWYAGSRQWQHHCDLAIELHLRAIELWRQGKRARWVIENHTHPPSPWRGLQNEKENV